MLIQAHLFLPLRAAFARLAPGTCSASRRLGAPSRMPPVYLSRPEHHAALLTKYDTFLFDLDGVVWMGPAGETRKTFVFLRRRNLALTRLSLQ